MRRLPARVPTGDKSVDTAIDDVRRPVAEMCVDPYLNGTDITVDLVDGVENGIRHKLGRRFVSYSMSAPIGAVSAGYIVERAPDADRQIIYLTANGYGATITVRLRVW